MKFDLYIGVLSIDKDKSIQILIKQQILMNLAILWANKHEYIHHLC